MRRGMSDNGRDTTGGKRYAAAILIALVLAIVLSQIGADAALPH